MTTRTVTGTIYHLDGTAWASGVVSFVLLDPYETSTTVFPGEYHNETLDASGQFSITLGVPDTGTAHYEVRLPDSTSHEFYLAAGSAVDLVTLITVATTGVSQDDLQTLLDAAEVFTATDVTTTHAVQPTEEYLRCDGTFTVTLPAATGTGRAIVIKNYGTGTITLARAGSDTIDGYTSVTIPTLCSSSVVDGASARWDLYGSGYGV